MSTLENTDSDEPRRKAMKSHRSAYMNEKFQSPQFRNDFSTAFMSKVYQKDDQTGTEIFPTPFRHVSLPGLIPDQEFIEQLIAELSELDMQDKNNDLFKFKQSLELKHVNSPCINMFRNICQDQVLPWLRDVTKLPLNEKVDMFCSNYDYTDTLLCHDDELEERHIAYIFYLVPDDWCKEDGGTLDLYDTDENMQAKSIVKSIVPKKNLFLFFEVTPKSFHQVAEVLTADKTRLAISGWFHGPPIERPAAYKEPPMPLSTCQGIKDEAFFEWINPGYLCQDVQNDIKDRFEAESELELNDFLKDDKYEELLAAMTNEERIWTHRGPANKRSYDVCSQDHLPPVAESFLKVLQSDAMFVLLSSMTGLTLFVPDGTDTRGETARCRVEVQRFKPGSYTLMHDTDPHVGEMALEVILFLGAKDWKEENGGYISYVAKEDDEELLSVTPSANCLAMVYKDKETLRFIKHINHRATKAPEAQYYTMSAVFYENAD